MRKWSELFSIFLFSLQICVEKNKEGDETCSKNKLKIVEKAENWGKLRYKVEKIQIIIAAPTNQLLVSDTLLPWLNQETKKKIRGKVETVKKTRER